MRWRGTPPPGGPPREETTVSDNRIRVKTFYALKFMDKSGPRLRADRKQQRALLSLLRQIRADAGLRQTDLAEALGMPQSVVSKYESGERRLDILELRQVCTVVGIELSDFCARLEKLLKAGVARPKA